jgi:hypothetical protein
VQHGWRWLNVPRSVSWPVSRIGDALDEQRGERQRLGVRPVDAALGAERLAPRSSCFLSFGWT